MSRKIVLERHTQTPNSKRSLLDATPRTALRELPVDHHSRNTTNSVSLRSGSDLRLAHVLTAQDGHAILLTNHNGHGSDHPEKERAVAMASPRWKPSAPTATARRQRDQVCARQQEAETQRGKQARIGRPTGGTRQLGKQGEADARKRKQAALPRRCALPLER